MRKKIIFISILLALSMLVLTACVNSEEISDVYLIIDQLPRVYQVGEEIDISEIYVKLAFLSGDEMKQKVSERRIDGADTSKIGPGQLVITTNGRTLTFDYLVVEEKNPVVTFQLNGGTGEVAPQTLLYGSTATEYTAQATEWGKVFCGWYLDDQLFDFSTPITQSITLTAHYQYDINLIKSLLSDDVQTHYESMLAKRYLQSDKVKLEQIHTRLLNLLTTDKKPEKLISEYNATLQEMMQVKSVNERIDEYYGTFLQENYFIEQWNALKVLYNDCLAGINNTASNTPQMDNLYEQTVEAMASQITKAKDIILAQSAIAIIVEDLQEYYDDIDKTIYSDRVLELLENIYDTTLDQLDANKGTVQIKFLYANALLQLAQAKADIPVSLDQVVAIMDYIKGFSQEDYFAEDFSTLTLIYTDAYDNLRNYEGGAPAPTKILKDAQDAIENVRTMAEDIELAEYEKTIALRNLTVYKESVDFDYLSDNNRQMLLDSFAEGTEAINSAIGTRAVAAAYGKYFVMCKRYGDSKTKGYDCMKQLDEAFVAYVSEDYFVLQWTQLENIYIQSLNDLRNFEGGAPSPDKIYSDAVKAMQDVVTKAEDIELAEYEKTVLSRNLNNFVSSLKEDNYSSENWTQIATFLQSGLDAINNAVGRIDVASAYDTALKAIQNVEKVTPA